METFSSSVQCGKCEKTFEKNAYLKIHMRIHSDLRPYICESCPSSFNDPSAFSRHKNLHREDAKIFTCDVCQKEFKTSSNLYGHKKFHSEEHLEQLNIMNNLAVLNAKRLSRLKKLWKPIILTFTEITRFSVTNVRKHFRVSNIWRNIFRETIQTETWLDHPQCLSLENLAVNAKTGFKVQVYRQVTRLLIQIDNLLCVIFVINH